MKKIILALSIFSLTACGGSSSVVSRENRGIYVQESHQSALVNTNFRGSFGSEETCALFKSGNSIFNYELTGLRVTKSGDVTGVVGIYGQVLDPGTDALIGTISRDNSFEPSDLTRSLSNSEILYPLEVEFNEFNQTMIIKPRGFDIPAELNDALVVTTKVSMEEFEVLNDKLTSLCR